jgi:hypothetical protein
MLKLLTHEQITAALLALAEDNLQEVPSLTKSHWDAFDAISARDPEGVNLITTLATSGSDQSRVSTTTFFAYTVKDQMESARAARGKSIKRDKGFDPLFLPSNPRVQRNEWVFHWNFHNVAQESGDGDSLGTLLENSSGIASSLLPALRAEHDSAYWRGVSALYLSTTQEWATVELSRHEPFILWAGHNDDIGAVVATARDRKTTDAETIRHLVEASRDHRALGSGAL